MSEQQKEEFVIRAENVLNGLEKQKSWLRNASIGFFLATIILIGTSFVNSYRVGENEDQIIELREKAASKESIGLLNDSFEATTTALGRLVDDRYEEAVNGFIEDTKRINDNIFMYSTSIKKGR